MSNPLFLAASALAFLGVFFHLLHANRIATTIPSKITAPRTTSSVRLEDVGSAMLSVDNPPEARHLIPSGCPDSGYAT